MEYMEAVKNSREKVRDGYLGDIPEDIRTKIMGIHKIIKSTVDDLIQEDHYRDLKESRWAMSCIDDFCTMPKDKSDIGSIRIFKAGARNFRAMIQATGHFRNHQYGWIEELLHDFIGNVFTTVRPLVRKKYDYTITNEGRTGNPFEGFDVYPPPKVAKELWDLFDDKKTKTMLESGEIVEEDLPDDVIMVYESSDGIYRTRNYSRKLQLARILEEGALLEIDDLIQESANPSIPVHQKKANDWYQLHLHEYLLEYGEDIPSLEEELYLPVTEEGDPISIEDKIGEIQDICHFYLLENVASIKKEDSFTDLSYDFLRSLYEATNTDDIYESDISDHGYLLTNLIEADGSSQEIQYMRRLYEVVCNTLNRSHVDKKRMKVQVYDELGFLGMELILSPDIEVYTEEYLTEKKKLRDSKVEREFEKKSMAHFKRKFNYTQDGYITIDGKKVKVDMNFGDLYMYSKYGTNLGPKEGICVTAYTWEGEKDHQDNYNNILEWQVIIPQSFFHIKGNLDNRDSILYHEIGHIIYQLDEELKNSRSEEFKSERDLVRKYMKKFSIKSNYHVNEDEFEADRYAANKTSAKALIKSLEKSDRYENRPNVKRRTARIVKRALKKDEARRKAESEKRDASEAERLGLTPEEYAKLNSYSSRSSSLEKERAGMKKVYQKYLDETKYPGKLSYEKFIQYFEIDVDKETYKPRSDLPKNLSLTRKGIAQYEQDQEKKQEEHFEKQKREDLNRRKKVLQDPTIRDAKYLKQESVEYFDIDEYLTEKKTQQKRDREFFKRSLEDFKKRFNYTSDGYATINGRRIHVDINFSDPYIRSKHGHEMERKDSPCMGPYYWPGEEQGDDTNVGMDDIQEWQIVLTKDLFTIKSKDYRQRDAIILHELGHAVVQCDKKIRDTRGEDYNKERENVRSYIKKLNIKRNRHVNENEFEADRYAANFTSERDMMKGLGKMYKKAMDPKAVREQTKLGRKLNKREKAKHDEEERSRALSIMSEEEYDKVLNQRKGFEDAKRELYQMYLKDPKYPGKLSYDQFRNYFKLNIQTKTYEPNWKKIPKGTPLTRKAIGQIEKQKSDKKKENKIQRIKEDYNRRKKAIRDPAMRSAEYLKQESAWEEYLPEEYRSEEYFMERQSRKPLKVDHRLAHDHITGHDVHIIYSLDGIHMTRTGVDGEGHGHKTRTASGTPILKGRKISPEEHDEEVRKLRMYGNTDHESYGQKVLAIIDLEEVDPVTKKNKRLQRASTSGAFGWSGKDRMDVEVGQVDYTPNWKTTFWYPGGADRNTSADIVAREGRRMRGMRGRRFDDIAYHSDTGDGYFTKQEVRDAIKKGKEKKELYDKFTKWRPGKHNAPPPPAPPDPNEKSKPWDPWDDDDDWFESVTLDDVLFIEETDIGAEIDCGVKRLPKGLATLVSETNQTIKSLLETLPYEQDYTALRDHKEDLNYIVRFMIGKNHRGEIGRTIISIGDSGNYTGEIRITPMPEERLCESDPCQKELGKILSRIEKQLAPKFKKENPGKRLILTGPKNQEYFIIALEADYAEKLHDYLTGTDTDAIMIESTGEIYMIHTEPDQEDALFMEAAADDGTDIKAAKNILRNVSHGIINGQDENVTQYTANIYSNIITKNLLNTWAPSYRKFIIELADYQGKNVVEFKVPKMRHDFVSRYINGREPIEGFLHRQPEIKLKMSPTVFKTMKDPDDAFFFFRAAILYYDNKITRSAAKLMAEAMRMSSSMKHLISTTKLQGLVTYPLTLLFCFNDVDMSNYKEVFHIVDDDIQAVSKFIRNIPSTYAAPEKEKKKIIEDVQAMVKSLRETCEIDDNIRSFYYLPEAIQQYYEGKFEEEIRNFQNKWIDEQVDYESTRDKSNPQASYLREAWGVKKLKKIPADLVAYVQIEGESIRDANDKYMIASYCLSKIEIIEWYIELIDTGNKKYIVPHTKSYLQNVRTQLLACYKKIMDTPIPKITEKPIIDIKFPKGLEG